MSDTNKPTRAKTHTGYKELDDAICAHIRAGLTRPPIYDQRLLNMAVREIGGNTTESDERVWRLIDRRLQALCKSGRIRHVRETGLKPRWEVV